jgi:hypothetical protein
MSVFLHERDDFKDLIEITSMSMSIQDPALVEKDYWLMHVLWGLHQQKMNFHLKGGTSLSKGYGCINRFSEDIDLKIEPAEDICGFKVKSGKNHDDEKHRLSRQKYFDWIASYLNGKISGVVDVARDRSFDDLQKFRNGGVRLFYKSFFSVVGLKEGILLEVGFDRTAPNQPLHISSWAYDRAAATTGISITDTGLKTFPAMSPSIHSWRSSKQWFASLDFIRKANKAVTCLATSSATTTTFTS